MSDGNPQAGLDAYERDIPLSLVAKYCEYNYTKNTILLEALVSMFSGNKGKSRSGSMLNVDEETKELVNYYAKIWEKRGKN